VEDILDKRYCCGCLLLGVVLLCVAIVLRKKGAFRRDGGKFPVLAAEGPGMIVAADAGAESVERNHGKVYIEFPQIGEGLPDVWGIKENLAVVFHDDEGNRGEIGAVFHKKGEYRIKISGKNDGLELLWENFWFQKQGWVT